MSKETIPALRYPDDYKPAKALDKVTGENFKPKKGAEGVYHVKLEQLQVNNGYRNSSPYIQTFPPRSFDAQYSALIRMGYQAVVLYDPTEYLSKQEKAEEERKAAASVPVSQQIAEALAAQDAKHKKDIEALRAEMSKPKKAGA